jgi:hypothetical protein
MRIYSEISFKVDMDLAGVDEHTRDYDVQRHKKEIYDFLQKRLASTFGDARDMTIHYLEFCVTGT